MLHVTPEDRRQVQGAGEQAGSQHLLGTSSSSVVGWAVLLANEGGHG